MNKQDLSHWGRLALERLGENGTLCAQSDATAEGGMLYWVEPRGQIIGPSGAREIIAKGYVTPTNDGLFNDASQCWKLAK